MEGIQLLWRRLNRPNPAAFRKELLKRGIDIPADELREFFYAHQTSKELFAAPPKYEGKIFSKGPDQKWFADILEKEVARPNVKNYWLVVQDEFSRFGWEEQIASPADAHAGMAKIFERAGKTPEELVTDRDPGFTSNVFQEMLRDHGVHWTPKSGKQDLATVDRLIGSVKRAQAEGLADGHPLTVGEALEGQNERLNATTHAAPEELREAGKSSREFFDRAYQEAEALRDTVHAQRARAESLAKAGQFRVYRQAKNFDKHRIDEPIWSREVHRVRRVDGAYVEADDGKRYLTKEVRAARGATVPQPPPVPMPRARAELEHYRARAVEYLEARGGRAPTRAFGMMLNGVADIRAALTRLHISAKQPTAALARVYPDVFAIEGNIIRLLP